MEVRIRLGTKFESIPPGLQRTLHLLSGWHWESDSHTPGSSQFEDDFWWVLVAKVKWRTLAGMLGMTPEFGGPWQTGVGSPRLRVGLRPTGST